MPYTTFCCDWEAELAPEGRVALEYVAEMHARPTTGELVFVPAVDMVVRLRRIHRVALTCPPGCVLTKRSTRNRCFCLDLLVDLRERRVLKQGVPGAQRVFRRLDWHAEESSGVMTCFTQLDGIATASWRAHGLAHTVFQLCNPHGPVTGPCVVVTPEDFLERIEFYQ
tara:strand:+ start:291 stop:794 length:504 start_codon:yes stop_codon:yes gene_type:complete